MGNIHRLQGYLQKLIGNSASDAKNDSLANTMNSSINSGKSNHLASLNTTGQISSF